MGPFSRDYGIMHNVMHLYSIVYTLDQLIIAVCCNIMQLYTAIIHWLPVCGINELMLSKELTKKPERVS